MDVIEPILAKKILEHLASSGAWIAEVTDKK